MTSLKKGAAKARPIYVSWTEQWDLGRYVDHYLESRKYLVNAVARATVKAHIAKYPSTATLKKSDLDFYLDRNVPKLALAPAPKGKGKR